MRLFCFFFFFPGVRQTPTPTPPPNLPGTERDRQAPTRFLGAGLGLGAACDSLGAVPLPLERSSEGYFSGSSHGRGVSVVFSWFVLKRRPKGDCFFPFRGSKFQIPLKNNMFVGLFERESQTKNEPQLYGTLFFLRRWFPFGFPFDTKQKAYVPQKKNTPCGDPFCLVGSSSFFRSRTKPMLCLENNSI